MKNNFVFSLTFLVLLTGTAIASSGSFGEVAGYLTYNALITAPQTHTWTLVNTFNTTLPFSIVKPVIYGVNIMTSVMNGTIQPDAYFPINVTIISNTTYTETGYISAYAESGGTGNSGGSQIRLGTIKLIEINGTSVRPATTIAQALTTIPQTQIIQGSTTTVPTTNSSSSGISAGTNKPASTLSSGVSNLILPIFGIILVVIGVGLGIAFSKRNSGKVKKFGTRKKAKRKTT